MLSSLTTRPIEPPCPLSSANPKPTHSQAIANLIDAMPSQFHHDLANLNDAFASVPGTDEEEEINTQLLECK
jgi:hypothetical protein